jgi:tetrahydromethanopterin S-methyltransferase subunit F
MLMRDSMNKSGIAIAGVAAIVCGWVFAAQLWGIVEPWVTLDN